MFFPPEPAVRVPGGWTPGLPLQATDGGSAPRLPGRALHPPRPGHPPVGSRSLTAGGGTVGWADRILGKGKGGACQQQALPLRATARGMGWFWRRWLGPPAWGTGRLRLYLSVFPCDEATVRFSMTFREGASSSEARRNGSSGPCGCPRAAPPGQRLPGSRRLGVGRGGLGAWEAGLPGAPA